MTFGKTLIKAWNKKEPTDRPPFIPFVQSHAAGMQGLTYREMVQNPGSWTHALTDHVKLFGYDGITVPLSLELMAESLGCRLNWLDNERVPQISSYLTSGDWAEGYTDKHWHKNGHLDVVSETVRRLVQTSQETAVCTIIPGIDKLVQKTLSETDYLEIQGEKEGIHLCHQQAAKGILYLAKILGEFRPDILFIKENDWKNKENVLQELYQPVINVVKYYRVPLVFLLEDSDSFPYPFISGKEVSHPDCVGQVLPESLLTATEDIFQFEEDWQTFCNRQSSPFLLVTKGEVPFDLDAEQFHDLMDLILG